MRPGGVAVAGGGASAGVGAAPPSDGRRSAQPSIARPAAHQGRAASGRQAAASSRLLTPSFDRISETWYLAPSALIPSRPATCSLVRPSRSRSSTSDSRGVRISGYGGRPPPVLARANLHREGGEYTT